MLVAQISPVDDSVSVIDTGLAYDEEGWKVIKRLLEKNGWVFVEVSSYDVTGTHYDREKGEFYTPPPPEPTQEELNNLALMEGIAGLYETQVALEERMIVDNLTVMEGIVGLFEAQMGGV